MTTKTRTAALSIRAVKDDERKGIVEAYGTVFGTRYDVGYALERVVRGAFLDSLEDNGTFGIYHEHGWRRGDAPIGVGTAEEDETGLRIEAELFVEDDPKARSVYAAIERGALREWSIGFVPREEAIVRDDDGLDVVEVRKADLLEVSSTIRGANPDTSTVGVRASDRCAVCDRTTETRDERPTPATQDEQGDHLRLEDPAERWLAGLLSA